MGPFEAAAWIDVVVLYLPLFHNALHLPYSHVHHYSGGNASECLAINVFFHVYLPRLSQDGKIYDGPCDYSPDATVTK